MKIELVLKRQTGYSAVLYLLLITFAACEKVGEEQIKVKAPLRNYTITARLDNKQAGTDSQATGILKGSYSETNKMFSYRLEYENLHALSISINKGTKGAIGVSVLQLPKPDSISYSSPINGTKFLSSLEERDLIKGLWFVTIQSADYPAGEIRGQITLKQK